MSTWVDSILKPQERDEWRSKISALREMLKSVGSMWPESTKLAGYGEKGPYHCGDCKYLKDRIKCAHPVVMADGQVKKDKDGMPIVNPAKGCCEFVEPV